MFINSMRSKPTMFAWLGTKDYKWYHKGMTITFTLLDTSQYLHNWVHDIINDIKVHKIIYGIKVHKIYLVEKKCPSCKRVLFRI